MRIYTNNINHESLIRWNVDKLHKKINSYKQQDIKKDKNLDGLISYEELLEKLVLSKLKCYYCRKDVLLLYENNREQKQWTLDRLDNSLGHTKMFKWWKISIHKTNENNKEKLILLKLNEL